MKTKNAQHTPGTIQTHGDNSFGTWRARAEDYRKQLDSALLAVEKWHEMAGGSESKAKDLQDTVDDLLILVKEWAALLKQVDAVRVGESPLPRLRAAIARAEAKP
jgi:hypothetical protein